MVLLTGTLRRLISLLSAILADWLCSSTEAVLELAILSLTGYGENRQARRGEQDPYGY